MSSQRTVTLVTKPAPAVRVTTVSTKQRNPTQTIAIPVVTTKRRRRRQRRRQGARRTSGLLQQYINCLNSPFEQPPVRLGLGTLIPTSVHTAYFRAQFQTAADGSFDLTVIPNLRTIYIFNSSGNTVVPTGYGSNSASNLAALSSIASGFRVLAMGLRIFPSIAMTSAPGFIALGVMPRLDDTDFGDPNLPGGGGYVKLSTSAKSSLAFLNFHKASAGASGCFEVLWRPQDLRSFEFDTDLYTKPPFDSTTNQVNGPMLVAVGQAMPASTLCFFEVILHLETTMGVATVTTAVDDDAAAGSVRNEESVFSVEELMTRVQPLLEPSVKVVDESFYSASKVVNTVRGIMGQVSNNMNSISTGINIVNNLSRRVLG